MFISVIIPTYNRAETIKMSIESVLNQTYEKLEVIVIDDGSKDNTSEIVKEINDERLRYIYLDVNSGASKARNIGVSHARFDLIAFQDSDDVWRKDKLQKQIEKLKDHPESSLVYCAYQFHDKSCEYRVPPDGYDKKRTDGDIYRYLLENNTVGAPTMLMKKDVFEKLGGFDVSYPALEDWELVLRVASSGVISYVDETLVDVYRSIESVSSSFATFCKARCKMIAAYISDLQRFGIFDAVVGELFSAAEDNSALDYVKSNLMLALAQSMGV